MEVLPDVTVRAAGRGGRQIDIRGARRSAVKVLIDGVALDDPYFGNFDLGSLPTTDLAQVRVSTAPASPIDGPGGPGGVVELHTADAFGDAEVLARATAATARAAVIAATGLVLAFALPDDVASSLAQPQVSAGCGPTGCSGSVRFTF